MIRKSVLTQLRRSKCCQPNILSLWLLGIFTRFHFTKSKCFAEIIACTMLKLRKNIAVPQMSIWKQNKALGTYCVSAYICRTKQWSFFFWYYYIQHGIEKTIYYGSKRATTKEWELTSEDDFLYSRVLKIIMKEQSIHILLSRKYKSEECQLPLRPACRQTTACTVNDVLGLW